MKRLVTFEVAEPIEGYPKGVALSQTDTGYAVHFINHNGQTIQGHYCDRIAEARATMENRIMLIPNPKVRA